MNKKGLEISPPSLVVAIILVLLVLVILIFILGGQSGEFVSIINSWRGDITENKCESPLFSRTCDRSGCSEGYRPEELPPPPGGEWSDCEDSSCYECVRERN